MYAIPVVLGSLFNKWDTASSPPAEAPIPTTGKLIVEREIPCLNSEALFVTFLSDILCFVVLMMLPLTNQIDSTIG